MNAPNLHSELESLRIPREQRPAASSPAAGRTRRVWLGLTALAVAAGGMSLGYLRRDDLRAALHAAAGDPRASQLRLVSVTRRDEAAGRLVLTATGRIVSDHRVQVVTKVSGQIVGLYFEQGDEVKKDQLLARIEDVNYRARRDEAQAQLDKSQAALAYEKVNFARVDDLFRRGTAPEIEWADAKRRLDEAAAQVEAARAALTWCQKAVDDCRVVAPIAGVILERNVEVGDFVAAEGGRGANANAQFATIADMSLLRVEVDVSEMDIARLTKGMRCEIAPDAYKDRRYSGHILWIDPGANYSKATVQVKVRIDQPDEFLRVEGSAKVSFIEAPPASASRPAEPSIWIPASACRLDASGRRATVFVAQRGRLRAREIAVGRQRGGEIEVCDGLAEGEQIAADGIDALTDGQRVPRNPS